jgi:hypothetical protein
VLLDLDPQTASFDAVVESALLVREALNILGLDAVPMTTAILRRRIAQIGDAGAALLRGGQTLSGVV